MASVGSRQVILPWLTKREIGNRNRLGEKTDIYSSLYSSVKVINTWDPEKSVDHTHHGGIFNLGYSTDGSLLVAACERRSILMFDPANGKLVGHRAKAHSNCVNCVRFLDSRIFATCSDDTTVKLWDARNLKTKIRTLKGHSNWVKNIEYSSSQGLLITSGFDNHIFTWDINDYSESLGRMRKKVFRTSGLMRSKLSPDESKLVISNSSGYIVVIHDLDLTHMAADFKGFKCDMYRYMQMTQSANPPRMAAAHTRAFTRKRNRVEFITDFPPNNVPDVIASLQVHPQGWCVLSRNTSGDEKSEWTCVHDIQNPSKEAEVENPEEDAPLTDEESDDTEAEVSTYTAQRPLRTALGRVLSPRHAMPYIISLLVSPDTAIPRGDDSEPEDAFDINITDSSDEEEHVRLPQVFRLRSRNRMDYFEGWGSEVRGEITRPAGEVEHSAPSTSDSVTNSSNGSGQESADELLSRPSNSTGHFNVYVLPQASSGRNVLRPRLCKDLHQNIRRLLFYRQEPNVGKGFIKEQCFSTDGRLVCSPFQYGVRLLSFSPKCEELSDCSPRHPAELHELHSDCSHKKVVLTTHFNPVHCSFVSGCLGGRVVFHQPVL